jgi:CRISPR/Cas system-associated protein Cas10 (large subunit of type III CRISPR-Cas system)
LHLMDHERTEKELEEIFEEIQLSYKNFADEAFALQARTLEFARELLESQAGRKAEGMRTTLEGLADKSRGERERFETVARKAGEAYLRVLKGPVDEHHHKTEQAEAELKDANSS